MKDPIPIINTPHPSHLGLDAPGLDPRYDTGIAHNTDAISYAPAINPEK